MAGVGEGVMLFQRLLVLVAIASLVARAAVLLALFLLLVHDGVEDFQEAGLVLLDEARGRRASGRLDGDLHGLTGARAALGLLALRLLALELALGLGAVGGLDALVLAVEFLADRAALGLGSGASGVALSRVADGFARRAGVLLAVVLGAADGANGAFAVNGALSAGGLCVGMGETHKVEGKWREKKREET